MRALAVLFMLQGHTFHALLATELKSMDSFFYSFWHSFRGYTAPIFMFTAGTVFSYLLYKSGSLNLKNIRIKKGITRAFILLGIGYFLRFPTFKISQLLHITDRQWKIFFAVDALHLIAIGLLAIILTAFVTRKIKMNHIWIYSILSLIIFGAADFIKAISWIEYLPIGIASYFTYSHGSLFPLFPWLGFMFAGAGFGYVLSDLKSNSKSFSSFKLSSFVMLTSLGIIGFSFLSQYINQTLFGTSPAWINSFSLSLWRLAIVLMMNSVVIFLAQNVNKLPAVITLYGKHSLMIYAAHLIIIYGSAVIAGLSYIYGNSLTVVECLIVFILLNIVLLGMCYLIEFLIKNKQIAFNFANVIYNKMIPGVK